MRKTRALTQIQELYSDRPLFLMLLLLLIVAIAAAVSTLFMITPQDIAIAVRYSAFGETHFYRESWYYMLNFTLFIALFTTLHGALVVKLRRTEDIRGLAISFGWFSVLLLVAMTILIHSVLGLPK